MTYSSKALLMTFAILYAHAYSKLVHADIWDELLPVRTAASDARKVYQCADDDFEVVIELRKEPDGSHRLLLSIANKKVRDGRMYEPNQVAPAFNADTDVDVAI